MLARSEKAFIELFNEVEDPREDERILYPLAEILFLAVCGVLTCAESWRELVRYGKENIDFLRQYFPYEQGIPSKSVLSRVFGMVDKKSMERLLIEFAGWFREKGTEIEIIALDGKRVKGSQVHFLHALSTRSGMVLAQVDIDNKINESSAIPGVLEALNIEGAVVTADALNCQKAIVAKIRERGGDYFIALKGNQGTLFEEVRSSFLKRERCSAYEELDKGHGRVEARRCWSTDDIGWIKKNHPDWRDMRSISCIERERHLKGSVSREQVFYLSSTAAEPKKHLHYSRQHWRVESMHWVLDVIFGEDQSTYRAKCAAQNMAIVRKLVINMIKNYKQATGDNIAIKTARKAAGWSSKMATKILKYLRAN